ncbi:cyclic nucleotide-gated ion channel 1 [Rosa chinensis]|uniref:cyclic nucleotide-gated ion channel 1 n=1 Tax=Rosa chinensis TaxID=74649 RepID=UPI000D091EEE|nr:cyclic nucleotide-gated ion channel 1 [Rosa chinensis]
MEKSSTNKVNEWSEKRSAIKGILEPKNWPTRKEFVDPKGPYIRKWNIVFIVSCVLAVLLDPLFLYIPTIHEDMKCVRLDKNMKIAALVLRSVTDLCYLLNIFFQLCGSKTRSTIRSGSCPPMLTSLRIVLLSIAKTMWESYIIIDILAVLPLPQVAILIFFPKMRGSGSSIKGKLMNFLILVQYVPRVLRIYLSCKESKKFSREETSLWLKGILNFFMYILASHVLGALCYFFAVQRITSCWRHACRNENGCDRNNFDCHNHHTLRNITSLNDLCPIDPSDPKIFDFGIFLHILQFGILGSTNYPEKFSNCFWWGLRHLSSLGSNLEPSINTWENLFAAFISIIGLLLFLYLIGNLQTYMQLDTARLETDRWNLRVENKLDEKSREFEPWLVKNGIPSHKKPDIMAKVLVELKQNRDVDIENLLSILPSDLQSYVESCMPLSRLKKVPSVQNMAEAVLREISENLKPKKYKKDNIIISEDKPLEMMIFIVDGLVSIEKRDASGTLQRGAGQLFGEQLLCWPAWTSFPGISNESARAIGDVDVLVLMASDMERVGYKFRSEFGKEITPLSDAKWVLLESRQVAMLRKVPKLETMHTEVLKAISLHLKPRSYSKAWLTDTNEPLRMMIFVIDGSVEEYGTLDHGRLRHKAGYFSGEELLDYVLDSSFPALSPLPTCRLNASNYVDILYVTAKDLASVASEYRSNFSRVIAHPTDLFASLTLHWLKKVPMFRDMDEEVVKEISKRMKRVSYSSDTVIIEKHKPLEMMFVLLGGERVTVKETYPYHCVVGDFIGLELVHWITNWAAHTNFPAKLPLSHNSAKVPNDDQIGNAEVAVLWADDLKSIVSEFRSDFMKQTTLPIDSEGKLATFDPLTMVKKVPILENMDEEVLKAICSHLNPMKYSDDTPDGPFILNSNEKIDRMFFIIRGIVSYCSFSGPVYYHYSGNYFGEQLLGWVLDASVHRVPELDQWDAYMSVGDVEVLVLMAEDLAKVISEFETHFVRQIPQDSD